MLLLNKYKDYGNAIMDIEKPRTRVIGRTRIARERPTGQEDGSMYGRINPPVYSYLSMSMNCVYLGDECLFIIPLTHPLDFFALFLTYVFFTIFDFLLIFFTFSPLFSQILFKVSLILTQKMFLTKKCYFSKMTDFYF